MKEKASHELESQKMEKDSHFSYFSKVSVFFGSGSSSIVQACGRIHWWGDILGGMKHTVLLKASEDAVGVGHLDREISEP